MKTIKTNGAIGILMILGVLFLAGCASNQAPKTTTTTEGTTALTIPTGGILTGQTTTTTVREATTTTKAVTSTTFIGTPRTVTVLIGVFDYEPSPLTVTVGDTVVWKSTQTKMSVTSPKNESGLELDSPVLGPGETYSHTFTKVGLYKYYSTTNDRVNGRIYVTSDLNITSSGMETPTGDMHPVSQ
jgi:plastocyanin